ncbi:RHS repeat-associated core domain-containing protein [Rhabdothermincola sediminis]|uniref:RHS repeat-associated core domain-containing protein n=1 Tax=Rhabdothermincola sediminis TaxID=2751370 RepID=UPI001AA0A4E9|nr:RHS repeat-associated core domain-containing protein [Rhabdothermincola sediminis]
MTTGLLLAPTSVVRVYDPTTGSFLTSSGLAVYDYDAADNLVLLPDGSRRVFDSAQRLCYLVPVGVAATGPCDQPPAEAIRFSYDSNGNRTRVSPPGDAIWDLSCDQEDRLTKVVVLTGSGHDGEFTALTAARVLDSRSATGAGSCSGACTTIAPGVSLTVQVAGVGGVPAAGVAAVAVNVTVINTTGSGCLNVYPAGGVEPATSNVNWQAGLSRAGFVIAKVGVGGKIVIANHSGAPVDVVVDVFGWFATGVQSSGTEFDPVTPTRVYDTRPTSQGGLCSNSCNPLTNNTPVTIAVAGQAGIPDDATAVVKLSANGTFRVVAGGAVNTAHLVVDVVGSFSPTRDTWTYTYDPTGMRATKKRTGGNLTTYSWDHASRLPMLLTETTGGASTYYLYGPGGLPVSQINPDGSIWYYHHDQLGSTRALTNAAGNTIATYTYDPYGQLTVRTGTATTPLGYTGQYTDPETRYQHLRNRYYDPTTGQFLTRDPITPITREPYGYVYGNPLNNTDPTGLFGFGDLVDAAGDFVGGVVDVGAEVVRVVGNNVSPMPGIPSINSVAITYGMITSGGNCHIRSGRLECIGAASPISGTAFTFGDVVMNPGTEELSPDLFAHESRHSYQWGALGWAFVPAYLAARHFQGDCNIFEGGAGFVSGGYDECAEQAACGSTGGSPVVGNRPGG